ncbi:MAG: hypothetical protein JWM41_1165 [Gemmatimonadetes bacterium]|nr:hypothetical protein [Gemmatimonadota bacterium]
MTRSLLAAAALVFAAASASAQDPLTNAKQKAQKAAAATNAHIEAEQKPEAQSKPAAPAPSAQKPAAPGQKAAAGSQKPNVKLNIVTTDTAGPPPSIMREVYEYSRDGRRDPFVSLLTTSELRPTMSDLKLSNILYDHTGQHSVAILRDLFTNAQYRVTTGSALGRMRVSAIRLKAVVFTIDEFGTTRRDSLVLGDSTKARSK